MAGYHWNVSTGGEAGGKSCVANGKKVKEVCVPASERDGHCPFWQLTGRGNEGVKCVGAHSGMRLSKDGLLKLVKKEQRDPAALTGV